MNRATARHFRHALFAIALAGFLSISAQADGLDTLIIAGGPAPEANQVAIENNVRYLLRLLPDGASKTVLFADGDRNAKTVLFMRKPKELAPTEKVIALLFQGPEAWRPATLQFKAPDIPKIDGPAKRAPIDAAFERLRANTSPDPLLLYFTGHGSANKQRNLDNNVFDLWGETLSVKDLARNLSSIPAQKPVALIMVQCFSGAFGNLLFQEGEPTGNAVEQDIAGFFATVKEKMAAGCTPAVDEREYKDFSTYFFAALTGKDRVGRPVTGVDYNRDGRVGMDEAFCYTLIHNDTVDIPVCTSDVFLRRFMTLPDGDIFKFAYAQVAEWATPAQRTALEKLAEAVGLNGDDRLQKAYAMFLDQTGSRQQAAKLNAARRAFMVAREEERNSLFGRWPDLKDHQSRGHAEAKKEAFAAVKKRAEEGAYKGLLEAEKRLMEEEKAAYQRELSDARVVRLVRLAKSVVLAHMLRQSGDESVKRRFEKLVTAEHRSLLPWQGGSKTTSTRDSSAVYGQ